METQITRRSFVKGIAALFAVAVVPQILVPKYGTTFANNRLKGFNPNGDIFFKGTRYPAYFARVNFDTKPFMCLNEHKIIPSLDESFIDPIEFKISRKMIGGGTVKLDGVWRVTNEPPKIVVDDNIVWRPPQKRLV